MGKYTSRHIFSYKGLHICITVHPRPGREGMGSRQQLLLSLASLSDSDSAENPFGPWIPVEMSDRPRDMTSSLKWILNILYNEWVDKNYASYVAIEFALINHQTGSVLIWQIAGSSQKNVFNHQIYTHVLVFFFAVFSRTLKQEQNRIFSIPTLHDCSRGGFGWLGG